MGDVELYRKVGLGLLGATIVGVTTRSPFATLLVFSFIAGGALAVAYWKSLDEKPA